MASRFGENVDKRPVKKTLLPFALVFLLSLLFQLGRVTADEDHEEKPSKGPHSAALESAPHGQTEGTVDEHGKEKDEHAVGEREEDHDRPGAVQGLKLSPEERANIGLKTVVTRRRLLESVVHVAGVVKPDPDREAQVSSRVAGISVAVLVRVGDKVRKGQKLVEIESVEMQKLQVDLIQAENRMLLAMAELDRVKRLVESKIAAEKELIAAESRHQAVLNEIEGLSQQLVLLGLPKEAVQRVRAEKSISTFALRSPISGVVAERHLVLGEAVEPNKVLFQILDPSVVFVEGDAFEEVLTQLRLGQMVRIRIASYPGVVFTGRISRFSPMIDPRKRTIRLWVEVKNRDGRLIPNLFADMDIVVGGGEDVLAFPVEALIETAGKKFVFVENNGLFYRTDVVLGARDGLYLEAKKGLQIGDRVVTDGKQQIYTESLMARQGGAALGGHGH